MSEIVIKQVSLKDTAHSSRFLTAYAFRGPTPPLPDLEEWEKNRAYREDAATYAAFEDGKVVVSAAVSPMTQNIRGKLYTGGGIWAVATHPEARRKGYARQVLSRIFQHMHDEGMAFSTLYPFRESFYTRLGYATYPQFYTASFSPVSLQPLLKKDLPGKVEMMNIAEGYNVYYAFMQKQVARTHGMSLFAEKTQTWMRDKQSHWLAVARVQGEVKGILLYKMRTNDKDNMDVEHFFYEDNQGKYLLLEWFARHIDHIQEINVRISPAEHPEIWWPDLSIQLEAHKAPLGRIITISALDGMQVGDGTFTAHIHDQYCPWNEGSYRFASSEGQLRITPAENAECAITIQALTGLVQGTHDPSTFAVREWGDPNEDVQTTMRQMFSPQLPFLHEEF
ncbi:MAG TPA: GNAT family N-acetyltransferase [Dictyobacter sp.]|jgi:predicted acetyltransferase|nr:GNAT family N-acetyltransferase [Dictyobacter sp.]